VCSGKIFVRRVPPTVTEEIILQSLPSGAVAQTSVPEI
jgi:hypothetical protein